LLPRNTDQITQTCSSLFALLPLSWMKSDDACPHLSTEDANKETNPTLKSEYSLSTHARVG